MNSWWFTHSIYKSKLIQTKNADKYHFFQPIQYLPIKFENMLLQEEFVTLTKVQKIRKSIQNQNVPIMSDLANNVMFTLENYQVMIVGHKKLFKMSPLDIYGNVRYKKFTLSTIFFNVLKNGF